MRLSARAGGRVAPVGTVGTGRTRLQSFTGTGMMWERLVSLALQFIAACASS